MADFEVMHHFASTSPASFQTTTVLVIKFLRRREDTYGKLMLVNGELKGNTGEKTESVKKCETEGERVEAMRECFGIELTEEEREGIRGMVTELGRN
jgi:hypothetical protein